MNINNAHYLHVLADVRYWDDAIINGTADTDGTLIPRRDGDTWKPVIRLTDGQIMDWPEGTTANIHYKVCDAGEYFLADENHNRIAKYNDYYVPDDLLCVGDNGYGDDIIFKVGADGKIIGWQQPALDGDEWEAVA